MNGESIGMYVEPLPLEVVISDEEKRYMIARYAAPPEYRIGDAVLIARQLFMVSATHNDLIPERTGSPHLVTEMRFPSLGFRGLTANDCEVLLRLVSVRDAINVEFFDESKIHIIKKRI